MTSRTVHHREGKPKIGQPIEDFVVIWRQGRKNNSHEISRKRDANQGLSAFNEKQSSFQKVTVIICVHRGRSRQ